MKFKTGPPYTEGKEKLKKVADHSRLVGGRFNNQRNLLHMRLVIDGPKRSRSPYTLTRILKVYIEALTGFSHITNPDGLNNTVFSQGCILESISHCGNTGQRVHSEDRGGGVEPLTAWVYFSGQLAVMSSP